MANNTWKLSLRPFNLNGGKTHIAKVISPSSKRPLTTKGIARLIAKEHKNEFSYDTIKSIIELFEEKSIDLLSEGYSIRVDGFHIKPKVHGTFASKDDVFDSSRHSIDVVASATKELKERLLKIKLEFSTEAEESFESAIESICDIETDSINDVITPGNDIEIHGTFIKISDLEDESEGVFLINEDEEQMRLFVYSHQNENDKIMAKIPDSVVEGEYDLVIRTKKGKKLEQIDFHSTLSVL